jgi:uncharacterized protein YdaT
MIADNPSFATSQAKEWKKNASKEEIDQLMKHDDETKRGN